MRIIRFVAPQAALLAVVIALPGFAGVAVTPAHHSATPAAAVSAPATRSTPDTAWVHVGPAEGGTDLFVAWPAGRDGAPGIVVIQEWWGLNAHIKDVARRFARQGYVAVIPDLYHGNVATDAEGAHELSRGLEDPRALTDMNTAVSWLRKEPRVGKRPIGVIGFCMGGRLSELLAIQSSEIAAAVMFYGSPITDADAMTRLHAPLQGHFGADDKGITAEKVKEFQAGLVQAGKKGEVFTYPGAGHAFMNDTRPSYSPDAARQAWARTLAFFQKHLKGSS